MTKRRSVFLVGAVLVLGIASGLILRQDARASSDMTGRTTVTITLTKSGFHPSRLYVTRGTTVVFESTEAAFWPASDIHPTHSIYPEFDAGRAYSPGETWSFTFNREGTWLFHDHLNSTHMGTITVLPPGESGQSELNAMPSCEGETTDGIRGCWKQRIEHALIDGGIESAFDEMSAVYDEYENFSPYCHEYVHDLGVLAYRKYGERMPLTEKMSTCAQGFWHGYMEAYLRDHEGDAAAAKAYCDGLDDTQAAHWSHMVLQCYHGIGHGIMEYLYVVRPDLITDIPSLLRLGVRDCALFSTEDDRIRCSSGVVAVTANWIMLQGLESEYYSLENIFPLCRVFTERWARRGCALEFTTPALNLAGYDAAATFNSIISGGKSLDEEYVPVLVAHTALRYGAKNVTESDQDLARACDSVGDPYLYEMCMKGLVGGVLSNGEPNGLEYYRAVRFCAALADPIDRKDCAFVVLHFMSHSYGEEGVKAACRTLIENGFDSGECESIKL